MALKSRRIEREQQAAEARATARKEILHECKFDTRRLLAEIARSLRAIERRLPPR